MALGVMLGRAGGLMAAVVLAASGCGNDEPTTTTAATTATEDLRALQSPLASCADDDDGFPTDHLRRRPAAEAGQGAAARALREGLRRLEPTAPRRGWRVLSATPRRVRFGHGRPPTIRLVTVERGARAWRFTGYEMSCELRAVRRGYVAVSWRLDSSSPAPSPETTHISILVLPMPCTGTDAVVFGRPRVKMGARRVALTLFQRPARDAGLGTCERSVEHRVTVALREPLGARTLLDAGFVPPRRPALVARRT